MEAQALSTRDEYSFLKEVKAATELNTPLEQESGNIACFAKYTTGTLATIITPEIITACSALRTFELTTALTKLAAVVVQLQNSYFIGENPTRLVDPGSIATELPNTQVIEDFSESFLQSATIPVDYLDGIACVDGSPIWDRLENERMDFYNVFKLYRDSRYFMLDDGSYIVKNRTIAGLARTLSVPAKVLMYISKIYHWAVRCNCYDTYMGMQMIKRRQQESLLLQSDQAKMAKALCDKAMQYINGNFDKLQPKEVLQALEIGLKFGRLSVGLLPDKPGTTNGPQNNYSIVQNNTNNTADQMMINQLGGEADASPVERQLKQDIKDENNLLSILHVLQASGAMKTAVHEELISTGDEGLDIIGAEESDD